MVEVIILVLMLLSAGTRRRQNRRRDKSVSREKHEGTWELFGF